MGTGKVWYFYLFRRNEGVSVLVVCGHVVEDDAIYHGCKSVSGRGDKSNGKVERGVVMKRIPTFRLFVAFRVNTE